MRKQILAAAAVLMLYASGILAAQTPQTAQSGSKTYQWNGELVTFDANASTATIKSRLVDQTAAADVRKFKAGERVLLLWSGYDAYADAVRQVLPYSEGKATERFMLPVELVSTDTPNQYLTFRVRVPAASAASLKAVKPGDWVSVTSSHRASRETDAIVSVKPYVTTQTNATN
jgi:hypothetical protein